MQEGKALGGLRAWLSPSHISVVHLYPRISLHSFLSQLGFYSETCVHCCWHFTAGWAQQDTPRCSSLGVLLRSSQGWKQHGTNSLSVMSQEEMVLERLGSVNTNLRASDGGHTAANTEGSRACKCFTFKNIMADDFFTLFFNYRVSGKCLAFQGVLCRCGIFHNIFSNQFSILASHAITAISVWRAWGEYNLELFLHIFIFASSGDKKKDHKKSKCWRSENRNIDDQYLQWLHSMTQEDRLA